jgi:hypothetical protein
MAMTEILSTTEYAHRLGVKQQTVSMWKRRGRLTAPALRADGMIDVALADQQLAGTLDVMSAGRGGRAGGRLFTTGRRPASPSAAAPADVVDLGAARDLLRARALSATIDAERKRRELEHERGRYMLTQEAIATWTKQLTRLLQAIELSFADLGVAAGLDRAQMIFAVGGVICARASPRRRASQRRPSPNLSKTRLCLRRRRRGPDHKR